MLLRKPDRVLLHSSSSKVYEVGVPALSRCMFMCSASAQLKKWKSYLLFSLCVDLVLTGPLQSWSISQGTKCQVVACRGRFGTLRDSRSCRSWAVKRLAERILTLDSQMKI
jgi:hypothetical protein